MAREVGLPARRGGVGWVQALAFDPRGTRLLTAANSLPARIAVFQIETIAH